MSVNCDRFGFFNGVYAIEQENWSKFWKGILPDGVIAGQGYELEVYAPELGAGLKVYVRSGCGIVSGHRAWVDETKEIVIAENTSGDTRTDGIFLRVNHGNDGESTMELIAKTGSVATTRQGAPDDLLLAAVSVPANATTILGSYVTDRRYIFSMAHDKTIVETIDVQNNAATVAPLNDREYRTNNAVNRLTIELPVSPTQTYMTGVCFRSAASSYSGVTIRKTDGSSLSALKLVGDALTLPNKKYTLIIWYDGAYYWCAAKAAGM